MNCPSTSNHLLTHGFLLIAASLLAAAPTVAQTTGASSNQPTAIDIAGTTTVVLELTGETSTSLTPTDIFVIVDRSGSITPTEFLQLKQFIRDFEGTLWSEGFWASGGRLGIVGFDTNANLVLPLTLNRLSFLSALNSMPLTGGLTNIAAGLELARNVFQSQSNSSRTRLSFVLTDGLHTAPSSLPLAIANSEAAGIERFVLGIGNEVNFAALAEIASAPASSHAFLAQDFNTLNLLLGQIVAAVVSPGATGIQVVATVNSNLGLPMSAMATAGTVQVVGPTVTWSIPALGDETASLTYEVAVSCGSSAGGLSDLHSSIIYTDVEANPVTFDLLSLTLTCDSDGDGINDDVDNCPFTYNPGQEDFDGDGIGDVCDCDNDNDGIPDALDECLFENSVGADADLDGCIDRLADLDELIGSLALPHGIRNSLLVKVFGAQQRYAAGNLHGTLNILQALQNQISALRGGQIPNATADLMLAFIQNCITPLEALAKLDSFSTKVRHSRGPGTRDARRRCSSGLLSPRLLLLLMG